MLNGALSRIASGKIMVCLHTCESRLVSCPFLPGVGLFMIWCCWLARRLGCSIMIRSRMSSIPRIWNQIRLVFIRVHPGLARNALQPETVKESDVEFAQWIFASHNLSLRQESSINFRMSVSKSADEFMKRGCLTTRSKAGSELRLRLPLLNTVISYRVWSMNYCSTVHLHLCIARGDKQCFGIDPA